MLAKQFVITLREDTVISQSAVTTGGHGGLDYLTGSSILGAVASYLYESFNDENTSLAWDVFHSGKVRFSNALPISEKGFAGYPIPRSWYREKGQYHCKALRQHAENYTNIDFERDVRVDQYRGGYCTLDHSDSALFQPTLSYRMKTAINPSNGMAAEGQLFGYSSLFAGTRFSFYLEADDDRGISEDHFQQIVDVLLNQPIILGRSRSAEYGAVKIEEITPQVIQPQPNKEASSLSILLLADAVIFNSLGVPTLQPEASTIGLPNGWKYEPAKSFVYSRRYSPYNAHLNRRELEREALGMGSVLCFSGNEVSTPLSIEQLSKLQQQGIGSYRQAGLGRILVNPSILEGETPVFKTVEKLLNNEQQIKNAPNSLILRYLDHQADNVGKNEKLNAEAAKWANELTFLYQSARQLTPYAEGGCIGPSATQWGRVMELSRSMIENTSEDTFNDIFKGLFSKDNGICKPKDIQWDAQVVVNTDNENAKLSSFRDWLIVKIQEIKTDNDLPDIVARFARLAVNVAQKKSCQRIEMEVE